MGVRLHPSPLVIQARSASKGITGSYPKRADLTSPNRYCCRR